MTPARPHEAAGTDERAPAPHAGEGPLAAAGPNLTLARTNAEGQEESADTETETEES